jgi:hypothetical protein
MKLFNSYKPKLSDVVFQKETWELHDDFENNKAWFADNRDPARIQLFASFTGWPFDLKDLPGAREFFEIQSKDNGGALLELQTEEIKGIESLIGAFKYPSPIENHLGLYYLGIVWMPFTDFCFQVTFESLESGETGLREAAVSLLDRPQSIQADAEPELVDSAGELLSKLYHQEIKLLPSDDRQYDQDFPHHPLSKIRSYLQDFKENVVFNEALLSQRTYRVENA